MALGMIEKRNRRLNERRARDGAWAALLLLLVVVAAVLAVVVLLLPRQCTVGRPLRHNEA